MIEEEREDGVFIRPAVAMPVEIYTPERRAEFLLSNTMDAEDYARAKFTLVTGVNQASGKGPPNPARRYRCRSFPSDNRRYYPFRPVLRENRQRGNDNTTGGLFVILRREAPKDPVFLQHVPPL